MTTKTVTKPQRAVNHPSSTDRTKWQIIGRRLLAKLEREGIAFELTPDGRDFEFENCRVDDNLEPLEIPSDTVGKIVRNKDLLLETLRQQERSIEHWKQLLILNNPEWREEIGGQT